jgi:hypothetical protein
VNVRVLPLAMLLLVPASAAQTDTAPMSAWLEWQQGFGVGTIAFEGLAAAVYVPMDTARLPPAPAFLTIEGQDVRIVEEYRDYYGTPQGLVGRDTELQRRSHEHQDARLRLVDARREAQLLTIGSDGTTPRATLGTSSVLVRALPQVEVTFFANQALASTEFQRTYEQDRPVLGTTTDALGEAVRVEGDFVVHLWDIDVALADDPSVVFRSGTHRSNGIGQSDLTPQGAFYEARQQLLTIHVSQGHLLFALPQRSVEVQWDPAATESRSQGSWDLNEARGRVELQGLGTDVHDADIHLAGAFTIAFALSDHGVGGHWNGDAQRVVAAREPLATGLAVPRDPVHLWWPWAVGLTLLAAAGAATYGAQRWRLQRLTASYAERLGAGDYEGALVAADAAPQGPATDTDAVVTRSIALLKLGRSDEVVQVLEPGFVEAEPVAPVKAYLLSLAHLQGGRREEGVQWILRAVRLYPEFAQEIQINDAFAEIRGDPRIREAVDSGNEGGVAGYV